MQGHEGPNRPKIAEMLSLCSEMRAQAKSKATPVDPHELPRAPQLTPIGPPEHPFPAEPGPPARRATGVVIVWVSQVFLPLG